MPEPKKRQFETTLPTVKAMRLETVPSTTSSDGHRNETPSPAANFKAQEELLNKLIDRIKAL